MLEKLPVFRPPTDHEQYQSLVMDFAKNYTAYLTASDHRQIILACAMTDLTEEYPDPQERYYQALLDPDYTDHIEHLNRSRSKAFEAFAKLLCLRLQ